MMSYFTGNLYQAGLGRVSTDALTVLGINGFDIHGRRKDVTASNLERSIWLQGVNYCNGKFITVGEAGAIYTSLNGTNWERVTADRGSWLFAVAYANGLYIAVGEYGTVMISNDAINWKAGSTGSDYNLMCIAVISNTFYLIGEKGTLLNSSDGISWNIIPVTGSKADQNMYGIAFNGSETAVVGI